MEAKNVNKVNDGDELDTSQEVRMWKWPWWYQYHDEIEKDNIYKRCTDSVSDSGHMGTDDSIGDTKKTCSLTINKYFVMKFQREVAVFHIFWTSGHTQLSFSRGCPKFPH
jgi:hypothetical protein